MNKQNLSLKSKVAIIGAGRMGLRHIQAVRQMGLDLVGVCDIVPEALACAIKEQQVLPKQQFADAKIMLVDTHPDCVIVATTAPWHCQYTCLAAEQGAKFILCEKPMAVSLEECDRMITCCKERGAILAINHQMRFTDKYIQPKKIIQEELGGLSSVTVVAGNLGMAMNGTHYFEMFRYMTDEAPCEVTAWFSPDNVPNPRGEQFQDRAGEVRVVTPSGKRLYLDAGSDQGQGIQVIYAGKYGQIFVDELAGFMRLVAREDKYKDFPTTRYAMPWLERIVKISPTEVVASTKAVLEALFSGKDYPTGADGRLAIAALVGAYVSNENNHAAVKIDNNLPKERIFPWA